MKPAVLTERKSSSDASHQESVTSQVASAITDLNCLHRATTALHPFAPPQPSAVTFNAGIAFDYVNFPRIVSVCWPECNTQAGTSVVVRDELLPTTNKTAFNDIEGATGASVVNGGPTRTEPIDPPVNTINPVEKEHLIKEKENNSSTKETTISTPLKDELQTQKQRECCRSTDLNISTKVEANLKCRKHSRETPVDFIQEDAPIGHRKSRKASNQDGLERDCAKPNLHMRFCPLDDDNEQSFLKVQSSFSGVRRDDEKLSRSGIGNVTSQQFEAASTKFETLGASMGLKKISRSHKDDMESPSSIAIRPATEQKRPQNDLQKDNTQENVRDLIRRIRFIKSRLDRAESDFRKKRMLRAIVGLRKKVKSLTEGMKNKKAEQGKSQQKTGAGCSLKEADNSRESEQESDENLIKNSNVIHVADNKKTQNVIHGADNKAVTDQMIVDKGGDTAEQERNDKEKSREPTNAAKIEDEYKSKTSYNDDIRMKNSNCRKGRRGSLTLMKSNGGNESFLRLPSEIGLDLSSPYRKRSASSSNAEKLENSKAKKMKILSGGESEASINTKTEEVSHDVRRVTQSGVDENNATLTDDCAILARREFVLCYPDFTQCKHCKGDGYVSVKIEPSDPPSEYEVQSLENEAREKRQEDEGPRKDCQVSLEDLKEKELSNNSTNEYYQADEEQPECSQVSGQGFCSGINYLQFNPREQANKSTLKEHERSSLEIILQDEQKEGFTSPTIHNPSGRQEDIDLMQSLQIREARIRNLAQKRERLLNLAGLKFK